MYMLLINKINKFLLENDTSHDLKHQIAKSMGLTYHGWNIWIDTIGKKYRWFESLNNFKEIKDVEGEYNDEQFQDDLVKTDNKGISLKSKDGKLYVTKFHKVRVMGKDDKYHSDWERHSIASETGRKIVNNYVVVDEVTGNERVYGSTRLKEVLGFEERDFKRKLYTIEKAKNIDSDLLPYKVVRGKESVYKNGMSGLEDAIFLINGEDSFRVFDDNKLIKFVKIDNIIENEDGLQLVGKIIVNKSGKSIGTRQIDDKKYNKKVFLPYGDNYYIVKSKDGGISYFNEKELFNIFPFDRNNKIYSKLVNEDPFIFKDGVTTQNIINNDVAKTILDFYTK